MKKNDIENWGALQSNKAVWEEYLHRLSEIDYVSKSAFQAYQPQEVELRYLEGTSRIQIPCLVKDLFDVKGWPTTASSLFLQKIRGEILETSELVESLESLGVLMVGKTHLNEFAYGLSGENCHFGDCPHPSNEAGGKGILSGGSSSGSAYAVGKGLVPLALGSDTGGSVRVPAAFCGVWGIRYTPGVLMRGCFPLAPGFDTVGFFCSNRKDLEWVHRLLFPEIERREEIKKIGLLHRDWCETETIYEIYLEGFKQRNITLDVGLSEKLNEWMQELPLTYSILQSMEAYAVHREWLDKYKDQYDPATWNRIDRARHWTKEQVLQAEQQQKAFLAWMGSSIGREHCAVLPAVPCPSRKKADLTESFRDKLLKLTTPASMSGQAVITEPLQVGTGWETVGYQYIYPSIGDLFR